MAIQSSFYSGTALDSRTFPSTKHIATKQHMAVWRQEVSPSDLWVQMDINDYQLINNSCVLNQLLSQTLYQQLEVRVADEPNELVSSPTDIAIVAGIADEVVTVAGIEAEVIIVAGDSAVINTVAGDTIVINTVAGDTIAINVVANDTVALNLVADDLAKGIGTNQPTDSAILNALTNANQTIADVVLTHADVVITNGDVVLTNADVVLTHADVVLTNADVVSSGINATNAQLFEWEAEAERLTADSYATEAEDVPVNLVTSDGDGTFTYIPQAGVFSALHQAAKAATFNPASYYTKIETDNKLVGFKNHIINGDKRVNQRAYADGVLADGVYGYDRWKGVNTDVNIEQVIEQQNIETDTYTISWVGGGTATVNGVSGLSSGDSLTVTVISDVSVIVPKGATNIQLEKGSVATPFEQRPIGLELSLCQRYYEVLSGVIYGLSTADTNTTTRRRNAISIIKKRVIPTVSVTMLAGTNESTSASETIIYIKFLAITAANEAYASEITLDAEL